MPIFALTIFLGAFLVFEVQPLIGKFILPWFGGGSGVWSTCMVFFQVVLLAGYAYAHLITRWLRPRRQIIVHLSLLAGAIVLLPIVPRDTWKPDGGENPVWRILTLLAATLGLPYFVLSATGPLIQRWFTLAHPLRSPYRLYALSNVGSLLALLSYPLVLENLFTRRFQAGLWGWGLVIFSVVCAFCARSVWTAAARTPGGTPIPAGAAEAGEGNPQPGLSPDAQRIGLNRAFSTVLWVLLPACASLLLLATTNKLCQDVAVVPFLWVLPLAVYLTTFIISFDSPRWYRRIPFGAALLAAIIWLCWALPRGTKTPLTLLISGYSACLFVSCMVCHGELYRLRPGPERLTAYYLMIAAGGAFGSLLVVVVAPLVFKDFHELPLGFLVCGALWLLMWSCARHDPGGLVADAPQRERRRLIVAGVGGFALVVAAAVLWVQTQKSTSTVVAQVRNFYGVLTVREELKDKALGHHFVMHHGQTLHGLQFVDPVGVRVPTAYYSPKSGIGRVMTGASPKGRRVGIVGLGVATLATYGQPNDYFRFYEINPAVMRLATKYFTYAPHCAAKVDCVIGDARLSLEKEAPQNFDLLVLDAFSGDSVPVHLLTREAFEVYARHLATNGMIAVHISNNYLDLEPLLVSMAQKLGYYLAVVEAHPGPKEWWIRPTIWVLLSPSLQPLNKPEIRPGTRPPEMRPVRYWTDDFSSLYQIRR